MYFLVKSTILIVKLNFFFNVKIIDRQARLEIEMQPVSVIFCVVAAATLCHRL